MSEPIITQASNELKISIELEPLPDCPNCDGKGYFERNVITAEALLMNLPDPQGRSTKRVDCMACEGTGKVIPEVPMTDQDLLDVITDQVISAESENEGSDPAMCRMIDACNVMIELMQRWIDRRNDERMRLSAVEYCPANSQTPVPASDVPR